MFNYFLSAILLVHIISHLPGFLVTWKLMEIKEMPFSTQIFFKKIELGETGIKIWGAGWLGLSILFLVSAFFVLFNFPFAFEMVLVSAILSLLFSVFGLPDSKFGIVINLLLIIYVTIF